MLFYADNILSGIIVDLGYLAWELVFGSLYKCCNGINLFQSQVKSIFTYSCRLDFLFWYASLRFSSLGLVIIIWAYFCFFMRLFLMVTSLNKRRYVKVHFFG